MPKKETIHNPKRALDYANKIAETYHQGCIRGYSDAYDEILGLMSKARKYYDQSERAFIRHCNQMEKREDTSV